jgi:putative endonuclease
MQSKQYFVYILTNFTNTVLYVGVTNNLSRRIYEHKNNVNEGFSKRYNVHKLVYFEIYNNIVEALKREKYLKGKRRDYKLFLINKENPEYKDLSLRFD